MASAVSNLLIYQGADFTIDFTVENDNGTAFNLTGYTVACKIKKHYTSSTSTSVTAAVLSPATSGQIQLSLTNGQTTTMKSGRMYMMSLLLQHLEHNPECSKVL